MNNTFKILVLIFFTASSHFAQTETLRNATIIEMTKAGLSTEIISSKILKSDTRFDTTAAALIEMKKAGVSDDVLKLVMERADTVLPGLTPRTTESTGALQTTGAPEQASPQEAVKLAKTIAFKKSSAQPSRQNLEKALLKNADFKRTGLTILRIKEEADLFVEIGFVSGSWLTHRYVYRIYDRRSGAVLAAGETTSWGSLGDNLAKHISRSLSQLAKV
jgi:hypothetical protein